MYNMNIHIARVYTITVMSGNPFGTDENNKFRTRNWGYYFNEADAREVIENNLTDISEIDYYHYALLGSKTEGPLAITEPIQWYEFIWEGDKFIRADKIEEPIQYALTAF